MVVFYPKKWQHFTVKTTWRLNTTSTTSVWKIHQKLWIFLKVIYLATNMKTETKDRAKKKKTKNVIEKGKRKKYSNESLKKALQEIKNDMPKKQAARVYQVPRATLQFRIKNPDHKALPGPRTVLSEEEENKLKKWLITCSKKGFPKRKEDILQSVSELLKENQRTNPFKENIPGEKWFKLFLNRHPDITIRTPEAVTSASSAVSENDIKKWFQEIENYLKQHDLFEILYDPKRVLNGDETNFVLCAKTGVVLAPKGAKNVYEVDHAQAKTSLTVMFTFRASGEITPPMVIFPYKRLPNEISSKIPPEWGIGLSDNGWMKTEIFYEYIEKVLYPHLIKTETVFPVILFVDGHKTHLTYAVSQLCSTLNIVLVALYPNCTRVLQPADVSAFRPLKGGWQKTVLEWRRENPAQALTKQHFVPLLKKTIERSLKAETIVNGFRTTGLHPWNPNAIDYSKCLGKNHNRNENANLNEERGTGNEKLMKKQDFINIVGRTAIEIIDNGNDLTDASKVLKQLWTFFSDNGGNNFELDVTSCINASINQNPDETNIDSDDIHKKTNEESCAVSEINHDMTAQDIDNMDIERMDVVICEESNLSSYIPVSHEVLIEEVSSIVTEDNTAGASSDDDSQNIHCVQVSHTVQIETYKDKDSTNLNKDKNDREERYTSTNSVKYPNSQDFDKIKILSVEENYKLTTPIKTNLSKRVNLDTILKYPKTPERKGVKNSKRSSFVLTSADVQEEQLKKIKEKEENIRKRKEEREQKKLLLAKTKETKKERKTIDKKGKSTKKNVKNDSKIAAVAVKKILFSENFTNSIVDISLKNKHSDNNMKDSKEEEEGTDNEEICVNVEQNKNKDDTKIKRENRKIKEHLKKEPLDARQTRNKENKNDVKKCWLKKCEIEKMLAD